MKNVMKVFMIIILLATVLPNTAFSEEPEAIQIMYDAGIIKGDDRGPAPERYISYGEFLTVAERMYYGIEAYSEMEEQFLDWKEGVLSYSAALSFDEFTYEQIAKNFDCPITHEFAEKILMYMLEPSYIYEDNMIYIYYGKNGRTTVLSFKGLGELGYNMTVVPDTEYITREQACKMFCALMDIYYPVIGDYRPCISIGQYTFSGGAVICEVEETDISKEFFQSINKDKASGGSTPYGTGFEYLN